MEARERVSKAYTQMDEMLRASCTAGIRNPSQNQTSRRRKARRRASLALTGDPDPIRCRRFTPYIRGRRPQAASSPSASRVVKAPAGSSRPRRAAWPDQRGVKSSDPVASDFARSGARIAPATGKAGACPSIGPSSRAIRLIIARAGRPVKTFVSTRLIVLRIFQGSSVQRRHARLRTKKIGRSYLHP